MKNKAKDYFNYGLFKDAFLQLKIVGIMSAIIMAAFSFFVPLLYEIQNKNYEAYQSGEWIKVGRTVKYSMISLTPMLCIIFYVMTPLMMLIIFNFLNKRNACDFYHSIPCKRSALGTSFTLAVLFWDALLILESFGVAVFSSLIFKHVEVDFNGALCYYLAILVGCVFVIGTFLIAMSATGTLFSNVCVAAMIIAVPRIIVTVITAYIVESVPMLPFVFGDSILNDRYNVVTGVITGLFIRGSVESFERYSSVIYTLVVGLIYTSIGIWLFKVRKSEVATAPAINKHLQTIIRLVPAIIISLPNIWMIYEMILSPDSYDSYNVVTIIIIYVCAIIAYFVYEIMATKRLSSIKSAFKGLIWLVLANVVILVFSLGMYNNLSKEKLNPEDIKNVRIDFSFDNYNSFARNDSLTHILYNAEIDDRELIELLCTDYNNNVDEFQRNKCINKWNDQVRNVKVTFKCGVGSKSRYVTFSNEHYKYVLNSIITNEEVLKEVTRKHDKDDISYIYSDGFDNEEERNLLYELYETYMDELATLDNDMIVDIVFMQKYDYVGRMILDYKDSSSVKINIIEEMPKTFEKYKQFINRKDAGEELRKFISAFGGRDDETYDSNIRIYCFNAANGIDYVAEGYSYREQGVDLAKSEYESGLLQYDNIEEKLGIIADNLSAEKTATKKNLVSIVYWYNQGESLCIDNRSLSYIDDKTLELILGFNCTIKAEN